MSRSCCSEHRGISPEPFLILSLRGRKGRVKQVTHVQTRLNFAAFGIVILVPRSATLSAGSLLAQSRSFALQKLPGCLIFPSSFHLSTLSKFTITPKT